MAAASKREAILDAARSQLLEFGAAGLTLDAVLKGAGAGTGTFYHHFPDGRPQLVAEVYAAALREYEAGVLQVLRRNRDAETGVKALVHHHVRLLATHPDAARVLLQNRGEEPPEGTRGFQRLVRTWASAAGLPPLPAAELIALWLGPVLEWCRLSLQGSAGSTEAAADRLAQAAWDAVRDA